MGKIRKTALDRIYNGSPTCGEHKLSLTVEQRNAFVIDYCRERRLIEFSHREAIIMPRLSGWISLSTTERVRDIVAYAMTVRLQDSPTIITLYNLLAEFDKGSAFEAHRLAAFLDTRTAAPGGLKRLEARVRDILNICQQLGLMAFYEDRFILIETGKRFFRGGNLPQDDKPGSHFTIQPNFEVIVGPEFEPRLRFMLELLAERRSRDTVLTFAVTRKSIARARERDKSTDDIIRFFHDHSRNTLPQNVQFSIESWANSYGSIFFENVTLMRCRTPDICDSIVHTPDIAPYVMEQLSDTALIVSTKHIQAISEHLKKVGFVPEAFGETEPDSVENGTDFTPSSLSVIVSKHAMPDVHHTFIFPESLLSGGEEP